MSFTPSVLPLNRVPPRIQVVKDHSGGDRDVQRVASARHRDPHHAVADVLMSGRYPQPLAPHVNSYRLPVNFRSVVALGVCRSAYQLHPVAAFPRYKLVDVRSYESLTENCSHGRTHDTRIIRVRAVTQ